MLSAAQTAAMRVATAGEEFVDSRRQRLIERAGVDEPPARKLRRERSVLNWTIIKASSTLGVMAFVVGLSIWFRSRGSNRFDSWVEAGINAHSSLDEGACQNMAGQLIPGTDVGQFYGESTWDNCKAGDCGVACKSLPITVMEILGFAMTSVEFSNLYWYASTYAVPVTLVSAAAGLIAAKTYVGKASQDRYINHQRDTKAATITAEVTEEYGWRAFGMGVFSTRFLWSMIAFSSVITFLVRDANRMAEALNIYDDDFNLFQVSSVREVFSWLAKLDQFPASSEQAQVEHWVGNATALADSNAFTGMAALTAGVPNTWMYILTNGLSYFHWGLAVGMAAIASKAATRYFDYIKPKPAVLPESTAAATQALSSKQQCAQVLHRVLYPFGFASDTLYQLSTPEKDLSKPQAALERKFAMLYQLNNLTMMTALVVTVLIRMAKPGSLISKAFFEDHAKGFYGLLFSNFFGDKGVSTAKDQWLRESVSTVISYTLSLETMLGYYVYGMGAFASCSIVGAFFVARAWQQLGSPTPCRGVDRCHPQARGRISAFYYRAEHAILDEEHFGMTITKAAISVGLVVMTLASFISSMRTSLDGVCPVGSVSGFWMTVTAGPDMTFPGFDKCNYSTRGLAAGEAVSTAWPLMALGISVLVTKLDVLATMWNFIIHCCHQPNKHVEQRARAAGYREVLGAAPSSSDAGTESEGSGAERTDTPSPAVDLDPPPTKYDEAYYAPPAMVPAT